MKNRESFVSAFVLTVKFWLQRGVNLGSENREGTDQERESFADRIADEMADRVEKLEAGM